jgi:hypothetical protein
MAGRAVKGAVLAKLFCNHGAQPSNEKYQLVWATDQYQINWIKRESHVCGLWYVINPGKFINLLNVMLLNCLVRQDVFQIKIETLKDYLDTFVSQYNMMFSVGRTFVRDDAIGPYATPPRMTDMPAVDPVVDPETSESERSELDD